MLKCSALCAGRTPPMIVTTTPEDAPLPNLLTPEAAYATSLPASISIWDQVVRFGRVYLQNRTMDDLVAAARLAASQAASKLDNNGSQPILLDLPCTMFAIKAASAPDIMLQATKALRFAPAIIRLAEKVVAGMGSSMLPADRTSATTSASTAASFNGLHLRLEQDAKDWTRTLGGTEVGSQSLSGQHGAPLLMASHYVHTSRTAEYDYASVCVCQVPQYDWCWRSSIRQCSAYYQYSHTSSRTVCTTAAAMI